MWKDMFFSLLLHALALTLMIIFALWEEPKHDKPLVRIEVAIVSNKELATLQQQANPVDRPKNRSIQARSNVAPESISSLQAAPKPVTKPAPAARPTPKPEPAPRPNIKPQATAEFETILKAETLTRSAALPETVPEPIINLEQTSEPIVKFEPAMKPVIKFKLATQPLARLQNPAKPVLKLKAEPVAAMDMEALSEPVLNMESRPVPVTHVNSGPVSSSRQKLTTLPKPVPKAVPASAIQPVVKLLPMARLEIDPNYDPFAPLESATDQQRSPGAGNIEMHDSFQSELARITEKQLSQKEIARYIGRIRAAVERHWKIPVAVENIKDPLVKMILQPSGQIQSLIILESSGSDAIDVSLIRAVKAAAPFELPKQQFEYFRVNRIRFHPFK
jgi:outer membrane biosynthesis protein TonB